MAENTGRVLRIKSIDGDTRFQGVELEIFAALKPSGFFYTKEGVYLGKIDSGNNVYITDSESFSELQKGKTISDDKIIYFTEKYGFNNEQLLYRAHWFYGEGGGFFYGLLCALNKKFKEAWCLGTSKQTLHFR